MCLQKNGFFMYAAVFSMSIFHITYSVYILLSVVQCNTVPGSLDKKGGEEDATSGLIKDDTFFPLYCLKNSALYSNCPLPKNLRFTCPSTSSLKRQSHEIFDLHFFS
jgi:hypothetical protein